MLKNLLDVDGRSIFNVHFISLFQIDGVRGGLYQVYGVRGGNFMRSVAWLVLYKSRCLASSTR
jgi:hypothetical protein